MKNQNPPKTDDMKIVSRHTNEEIEEDEQGNLSSSEEKLDENVPTDGPYSGDRAFGENELGDTDQFAER